MSPIERTNVRIPNHLVVSARVVAALEGKSLAALVEEILAPELARREKGLLASRSKEVEATEPEARPRLRPRGRPRKDGGS